MKLKNYQLKIIDFCRNHHHVILSVGMGLGKTAATLHYLNDAKPVTCIIVAPKRVAETVWLQEAEKWGLTEIASKMVIVAGSPHKRAKMLMDTEKPYKIISRDNLKDVQGYSCDILIFDELTSFKNHDSNRSIYCRSIKAVQKIGLTGTFLANGAIDIFGQAAAVGLYSVQQKSAFYRWRSAYFRDKLAGSGLQFQKWVLNVTLDEILRDIRHGIFTLDSDDWLEIPEVEHVHHPVKLSESEMDRYNDLQSFLHFEIGGEQVAFDAAQKFAKLQTLCNGFIYEGNDDERRVIRGDFSTKLTQVADFCESCADEGERVLLFYSFVEEAIWLGEMLKERYLKFCSPKDKRFMEKWNDGEIDVLLAHPASAGHGLNLQHGGRICVWSSLTYNYEYFAQANARLARTGQNRGVQIHYFFADGTVERNQLSALQKKESENKEFINLTK